MGGLRHWGPIGWLADSPEEVWFFLRISAYAFFIGTVYWFLTYETAGTILLYGFGVGAGAGVFVLGRAARHARVEAIPNLGGPAGASDAAVAAALVEPDGPFGDESGRIPAPSIAPFAVGLGAAVGGLGLVLGPWLIGVGLLVGLSGAAEWLISAMREFTATDRGAGASGPR